MCMLSSASTMAVTWWICSTARPCRGGRERETRRSRSDTSALSVILPSQLYWPLSYTALSVILPYQLYCPLSYTALSPILPSQLYCPLSYTALSPILPSQLYCPLRYTALSVILPSQLIILASQSHMYCRCYPDIVSA